MVWASALCAENADVAQWQSTCFPSRQRGFDSRHRLWCCGGHRLGGRHSAISVERIEWAPAATQAAVGASLIGSIFMLVTGHISGNWKSFTQIGPFVRHKADWPQHTRTWRQQGTYPPGPPLV